MHEIEPFFGWRGKYVAANDRKSPFYGRTYSEFHYTNKVYNFLLHPQWDDFGSPTLYTKVLFVNYEENFAIMEMIGEWNDAVHNDIMFLKREVIDIMMENGISKFILIGENVLSFHGEDNDYYQEWYEETADEQGWIVMLNVQQHVEEDMQDLRLYHYLHYGDNFNEVNWRGRKPMLLFQAIQTALQLGDRLVEA